MTRLFSPWLLVLLLALGAGTWATVSYHRQQNRLYMQLQQLANVLTTENDEAARKADYTIQGLKAAVVKNRNQPADVAVLQRAENVSSQVHTLLDILRSRANDLRYTTDNPATPTLRRPPTAPAGPLLSPRRQQLLQQQVTALADTLRHLEPAGTPPLTAPALGSDPLAAEALADLSQLESNLLDHQAQVLKHLVGLVSNPMPVANKLLAAATAESNVVAPGDTYRAELFLVSHFGNDLRMQMACNGQPVAVGPDGVGLVRFRAPTRPGPASWTGSIRINQNGRDTTFVVRVPYRVVRQ